MEIRLSYQGQDYTVNLSKGIDCSSTYGDPGAEPRAWNAPPVKMTPAQQGDWVGEVAQGSSVNFFDIQLNPHGNGTHTECIGHITADRYPISKALEEFHFVLRFMRFHSEEKSGDRLVTLDQLKARAADLNETALLLDVDRFPADFDFSNTNAPYFESDLLKYLAQSGVKHFMTNLPSVDRESDGGALAGHRAFWIREEGEDRQATITEMVQVPADLREGLYFCNLQLPSFHNDAAPSRVMLYPLEATH